MMVRALPSPRKLQAMLIAQLSEVSKGYGSNDVLEGVHWQIQDTTRAALVGRNGAGKTTLFRLLTGELEPDRGTVWRRRGAVIAAMEQEVRVEDRRTLREEAASGLEHLEELHAEFDAVTRELGSVSEGDPGNPGSARSLRRTPGAAGARGGLLLRGAGLGGAGGTPLPGRGSRPAAGRVQRRPEEPGDPRAGAVARPRSAPPRRAHQPSRPGCHRVAGGVSGELPGRLRASSATTGCS